MKVNSAKPQRASTKRGVISSEAITAVSMLVTLVVGLITAEATLLSKPLTITNEQKDEVVKEEVKSCLAGKGDLIPRNPQIVAQVLNPPPQLAVSRSVGESAIACPPIEANLLPTPVEKSVATSKLVDSLPSQRAAMKKYPELARAGSPFNLAFLSRRKQRVALDPAYLANEQWPIQLADEVAATGIAGSLPPVAKSPGPALAGPGVIEFPSGLRLMNRTARAPEFAPFLVQIAVTAGNALQLKPYKWGGGHGSTEDSGYDCSGSVSYVLIKAGLLDRPLTSSGFASYGEAGPGRWITIYSGRGHVFMTVCGLRLDTGGRGGRGESGPRWTPYPRNTAGYAMRHPAQL